MNKAADKIDINVVGTMSGTSLDGLDICFVNFILTENKWNYKIHLAETIEYDDIIKDKLANAHLMDALSFSKLHFDYGKLLGKKIKGFIDKHSINPELISSHGQTIFHQPESGFTTQIGKGACIAAETGVDTICDFRSTDVALKGNGAPLVPIGDRYLFSEYDYCLNLGGFSNISYEENDKRIAYDICPVNFILNYYIKQRGKEFDKDGETARSGKVNKSLLEALNSLSYYSKAGPKSLGREDVEKDFFPLIDSFNLSAEDILSTYCEHIAVQIGKEIRQGKVLVTGGGAFNKFLIERMQINAAQCKYILPDEQTINFKEALIFAFLGVLYNYNLINCLSSVTGAESDSISGALYKAV
ncbi:MAG: anhydro-N-acetylmuramic acid kinase [Ignavibacteriaceae bacterium]|jgi:anhydro-N-acetylmuramic acid kinase|nr:anhydro-N-acetylmuramic acid kinase [Ignavibacteriaceae bacterium]